MLTCMPISNIVHDPACCQDQCGDQHTTAKDDQGSGPLRQLAPTATKLQALPMDSLACSIVHASSIVHVLLCMCYCALILSSLCMCCVVQVIVHVLLGLRSIVHTCSIVHVPLCMPVQLCTYAKHIRKAHTHAPIHSLWCHLSTPSLTQPTHSHSLRSALRPVTCTHVELS